MGNFRIRSVAGVSVLGVSAADFKKMSFRDKQSVLLTSGQVARVCRAAPRTVAGWMEKGLLPGYCLPGSKDRRFRLVDVVEFLRGYGLPLNELDDYAGWRVLVVDPPVAAVVESVSRACEGVASCMIVRSVTAAAAVQCRERPDTMIVYASVGRRACVDLLQEYERDRMVWGRAYAVVDPADVETGRFLREAGFRDVFPSDTPLEGIVRKVVVEDYDEANRRVGPDKGRQKTGNPDPAYRRVGPLWLRLSNEEVKAREKILEAERNGQGHAANVEGGV